MGYIIGFPVLRFTNDLDDKLGKSSWFHQLKTVGVQFWMITWDPPFQEPMCVSLQVLL